MLKVLLQLLIFSLFIFSNGYQSLVSSFMLNPLEEKLLKTIDELLDSELNIEYDFIFEATRECDPKYQKALKMGRIKNSTWRTQHWWELMIETKMARIHRCKFMKHKIESEGDGKSWNEIYLIPEVAYSRSEDL